MTPKKKHHHIRHKAGLTITLAGVRIRFWKKRGTPMVTVTSSEGRGVANCGRRNTAATAKVKRQNQVLKMRT
jgi:hypothetical protein